MTRDLILYCLVMSLSTYLIRMLPLVLIHKKIENPFLRSFLHYIPYAVLSAMVIPDMLMATGNPIPALCGFAAAMVLAWMDQNLITVAAGTCVTVFLVGLLPL